MPELQRHAWPTLIALAALLLALPVDAVAADPAPPAAEGGKEPLLLEPFAGYDVVFSPRSPRVLGADAAPLVQKAVEAARPHPLPSGCAAGDIGLTPRSVTIDATCGEAAFSVTATLSKAAAADFEVTAQPRAQPCIDACLALQQGLRAAFQARFSALAPTLPLREARAREADRDPLSRALRATSTGDRPKARRILAEATRGRPVSALDAPDALDLALVALEARADDVHTAAVSRLKEATAAAAGPSKRAFEAAIAALDDQPDAARKAAAACAKTAGCPAMPPIRALAAKGRFADAATLLDRAIDAGKPPMGWLKLRFGLASAQNDAEGEMNAARKMTEVWPELPDGTDLLSSGLARAGRYREAIETLHDLSRARPERDVVLGRIAGMVAFLRAKAGNDEQGAKDLAAIEARMKKAAADPKDIVARFLDATRRYYAGEFESALPDLEKLLNSGNRDPRIPLYTAMAHFWLGHQDKAEALIERAVAIGPSDPDVYYCRSQIARRHNLPLAVADLERYLTMTTRPWSIGPPKKDARVKAELDLMKAGRIPPDWDKPGPDRAPFEPKKQRGEPASPSAKRGSPTAKATDPPAPATPGDDPGAGAGDNAADENTADDNAADDKTAGANATGDNAADDNAPPATDPAQRGEDADERTPWTPIAVTIALIVAVIIRLRSGAGDDNP
jgi:tetratricopeptide (TPR) repeat protein